jgi:hypothetical protein
VKKGAEEPCRRQVRLARRRADSAVKADDRGGWIAWRCLLHGDFAFYAWADKS